MTFRTRQFVTRRRGLEFTGRRVYISGGFGEPERCRVVVDEAFPSVVALHYMYSPGEGPDGSAPFRLFRSGLARVLDGKERAWHFTRLRTENGLRIAFTAECSDVYCVTEHVARRILALLDGTP